MVTERSIYVPSFKHKNGSLDAHFAVSYKAEGETRPVLQSVSGGLKQAMWLKPRIPHGAARGFFSFRQGGHSRPPYDSCNVGLHVGDDETDVLRNRQLVADELGVPLEHFVFAQQVHGHQVAVIVEGEAGCGARQYQESIAGVDALVTNVSGLALAVQTADCVPLLFSDARRRVVAAAHSGWKGTHTHITRNVIDTMVEHFGSSPEDLYVTLGPSIRSCCYEVDDRVARLFRAEFGPEFVMAQHADREHFMLNLQACIRNDLYEAGVPAAHIEDCGLCTGCRTDLLFSHRMEQGLTGRLLGVIALLPKGAQT